MGKVALITGVTSGVGLELAASFVDQGWQVIGFARDKHKLDELRSQLGRGFVGYQVDLRNGYELEGAFDEISKSQNGIDLVVNNAAVFKTDQFINCTFEDIDAIVDTNLKGVMLLTMAALKQMKKWNKQGRIVNICSVAGLHGIENQAIYCASKFGLRGFGEALNQEIIKDGISVTTIFPGGINTPLWNEKNPYHGDVGDLLKPGDIVKLVEYISKLDPRVILKDLTLFPSNEWH